MAKSLPLSVFCSYAHKDENLREKVQSGLARLVREGRIQMWDDRKISPGSRWADEIDSRIAQSDIILFLVSVNFISSEYCMGKEVVCAMTRHEKGEARVIPIILEPCDWKNGLFGELQALPLGGAPLRSYTVVNMKRLAQISEGLRTVVQELSSSRNGTVVRRSSTTVNASQTILARLCNRVEQDQQLRDAWKGHYFSFQLRRRPFLCVLHGPVQEDHAGYVQRMAAYSLPQAIGLGRDSEIHATLKVKWADDCADRDALAPRMLADLTKELNCPVQRTEVSAKLGQLGEASVIYYELLSNFKSYSNRLTIESFFDFWASWPDLPVGQKLIVVLSVQYRPGAPPRFPKTETDIVTNATKQGRLSVVVLDELPPVSCQHVKDWIHHPEVERFCEVETNAVAWEAEIDDTFKDRSQIPMEQLVGTLNRMLDEYQRRVV